LTLNNFYRDWDDSRPVSGAGRYCKNHQKARHHEYLKRRENI
jgi:hypothetical protein